MPAGNPGGMVRPCFWSSLGPRSVADREALLVTYGQLVRDTLPRAARAGRWRLTADHCFGRVLLDHAVGGCWYDRLERGRTPAFRQLSDEQLAGAITMGRAILTGGDAVLGPLDDRSLAWRGKLRPS